MLIKRFINGHSIFTVISKLKKVAKVFNVLVLTATLSFDYATLILEIQMCVLFPSSKTKSIILHNLLTTLSWVKVMYKVLKWNITIDLAFFFLFMMLIFSMTGSTFWSSQSLLKWETNLNLWWKFFIWK